MLLPELLEELLAGRVHHLLLKAEQSASVHYRQKDVKRNVSSKLLQMQLPHLLLFSPLILS